MFKNYKHINELLQCNAHKRKIAVIGDVMLDQYIYGEVKRISPEAPVPVTRVTEERQTLGGAANVAANLASLGCQVYLGGMTGNDENRRQLCQLLQEYRIDHTGLIITQHKTITKLRVIGAHQQMLRIDFEEPFQYDPQVEQMVTDWFARLIDIGIDGIVISDYAKGVCSDQLCCFVIGEASRKGIPLVVDPKGTDWKKYSGASFITPNVKELAEAYGNPLLNEHKEIEAAADVLRERFNIDYIVSTRSEKGLSVLGDQVSTHIPTQARDVFDVSGAGDTVAAVLLLAVADGVNIDDSALLANIAAGIVVGKVGTYPIGANELLHALKGYSNKTFTDAKILDNSQAVQVIKEWREKGYRVVFTNGCFDILHAGHIIYLEKAKKLGDRLIIGLNSNQSVRRLKGEKRPIVSETGRARLLAALECVDAVTLFHEDTPTELLSQLKPHILAKGGDYTPDQVAGRESVERVEIVSFEEGHSTTGIVETVLERYGR